MKNRTHAGVAVFAGICLSLGFGAAGYTHTHSPVPTPVQPVTRPVHKEAVVPTHASGASEVVPAHAKGTFEVKVTPQPSGDSAEDATLGRWSIDKQFHGDLEATSKGQMLAASTAVKGSAGYVAMERVTGTLHGRSGTFILQHSGTMTRGAPQISVTVVPDSGTGQLAGLAGKMTITIADGKHSCEFDYTLAATP